MSYNRRIEEGMKMEIIEKIKKLPRYCLYWESMSEDIYGDFLKYDDIIKILDGVMED